MSNYSCLRRRTVKLVALAVLLVALGCLVRSIAAFVHLFYTHAGVLVTQQQIVEDHIDFLATGQEPLIPRITHQIFHNWTHPSETAIPSDWNASRTTCLDVMPEWEHKLWTAALSRNFIAEEYPWFLHTYDGFRLPVQRIDALRYFLLRHYGGVYIDLDNGCLTDFDPLRYYSVIVADGARGALSNNILGGMPNHAFWKQVTDSLISYAWDYPLPYVTISYATGQWFLTDMWERYHRRDAALADPRMIRLNVDGRPGTLPWVFFTRGRGLTWHNWDNRLFMWIGDHLMGFAVILIILTLVVLVAIRWLWRTLRHRYEKLPHDAARLRTKTLR